MRKQTWIRFGLSSVIMASAACAAAGVGCSGDDNVIATTSDSGKDGTTGFEGGADTGPGIDSGDGGGNEGGMANHAKILAVNATGYGPDFRFCFGTGTMADGSDLAVSPIAALPHDDSNLPQGKTYPGLYAGAGGPFPDLVDLEPKALTGFLIPMTAANITALAGDVKSSATERACDVLIGNKGQGGVLAAGAFFKIPTIPAGTFKKSNSFMLALTGCAAGDTSPSASGNNGKAKCGAAYDTAVGNIGLRIVQLDRVVADTTKLGLQVLHLAQAVDGFVSISNGGFFDQGVKTFIGLSRDDLDGGNPPNAPVGNGINYGAFVPEGGVAAPEVYANADYAHAVAYAKIFGYHTVPANADAGTDAAVVAIQAGQTAAFPFGALQKLSYGSFDGGIGVGPAGAPVYLANGNYTLIFLGDPTAQQLIVDGGINQAYDGHGIHFVMFPNDPALPKL